ncbi:MAG: RagB/SusD family nutrient uptake outer membrane protein [Chitinophagaceae bacterium]|nr:MAG: RagB/SusD family nutrient uptake outer membrane protein [Chitinophagaceae bacterium]
MKSFTKIKAHHFQYTYLLLLAASITCVSLVSCTKFVETDPPVNSTNGANVFENDATAIAALTGIYARMSNSDVISGNSGIAMLTGLSGDELSLWNGVTQGKHVAYYANSLVSTTSLSYGTEFWAPMYNFIFQCNAAIEGVNGSVGLTQGVKEQLLGEAKFLRAFFYFYLANFYGDVPLVLITDPNTTSSLPRSTIVDVYQQIVADLQDAKTLLKDYYVDPSLKTNTEERVRPNKWAAAALLARAYLYIGDYENAEKEASAIIANTGLYNLGDLEEVFLKNNSEAIWQLQPVRIDRNTEEAFAFIIPVTGPSQPNGALGNPAYLSDTLLHSFEPGDLRATHWIQHITIGTETYYYPYKYKSAELGAPVTEYLTLFRLTEVFLIRSEANAHRGLLEQSLSDLNLIRQRAGLLPISSPDESNLLDKIMRERMHELFTESGHRWFDLKRTGNLDSLMQIIAPMKGAAWQITDQLYPIPLSDILRNGNLIQNAGYE